MTDTVPRRRTTMSAMKLSVLLLISLVLLFVNAQPTCNNIVAPDGSVYDLSLLENKIWHAPQKGVGQDQNNYIYNITICGSSPYPCGNGACSGPRTAAVCQTWSDNAGQHGKCVGRPDSTSSVVGLNDRKGVKLMYDNGDLCGSCNPSGPRATVITLTCNSKIESGTIHWDNVTGGGMGGSNVFYIMGEMNCGVAGPGNIIQVSYYGFDPSCNGTDAEMIVVNMTSSCQERCIRQLPHNIHVTCGLGVNLPTKYQWTQKISFADDSCTNATSITYRQVGTCFGDFTYFYEACDESTVVYNDCQYNPYCSSCKPTQKHSTGQCQNRTVYNCLNSNHHNAPLYNWSV